MIVGDGPLMGELKAKSTALGLDHKIVFTGARTDVEELLRCMESCLSRLHSGKVCLRWFLKGNGLYGAGCCNRYPRHQ